MDSKFIQRVLSALKDKTKKAHIEAELTDHLELRKAYYSDIGYNEESAAAKAEQALGDAADAEIVGEQLAAIGARKRKKEIVLALISQIPAVFYLIVAPNVEGSDFLTFSVIFFVLCLELFVMIITLKLKAFYAFYTVSMVIQYLLYSQSLVQSTLFLLLHGENIVALICTNELAGQVWGEEIQAVKYIGGVLMAINWLILIAVSVYEYRNRKLKTTKRELKRMKLLKAVLLIVVLMCLAFTATVGGVCIKEDDKYLKATYDTLYRADKMLLDNVEVFMGDDMNAAEEIVAKTFPDVQAKSVSRDDYAPESDGLFIVDDNLYLKIDGVDFFYTAEHEQNLQESLLYDFNKFSVQAAYRDLFGRPIALHEDVSGLVREFSEGAARMEDIPLPANIHEWQNQIGFNYNTMSSDLAIAYSNIIFKYQNGKPVFDCVLDTPDKQIGH